jgi:dienelactone hydrolase
MNLLNFFFVFLCGFCWGYPLAYLAAQLEHISAGIEMRGKTIPDDDDEMRFERKTVSKIFTPCIQV